MERPQIDQTEVVRFCCEARLKDPHRASRVLKWSEYAVKHGSIGLGEVANLREASNILDPAIVRVPRVHAYFTCDAVDYLVTEWAHGTQRDVIDDEHSINAVARAVVHVHSFQRELPGPVGMAPCQGTIWPDDEDIILESRAHLEALVNSRLCRTGCGAPKRGDFKLAETPFSFTHGDLAPRNLIWDQDTLWLLDWEFGGYYPYSVEVATLRQSYGGRVEDAIFRERLEAALMRQKPLCSQELCQVECLLQFAFNNIRFAWPKQTSDLTSTGGKKKRRPVEEWHADETVVNYEAALPTTGELQERHSSH